MPGRTANFADLQDCRKQNRKPVAERVGEVAKMMSLSKLPRPTQRINMLRENTAKLIHSWMDSREGQLAAARSWWSSASESSHILRRGILAKDILSTITPTINDGELLVGKPNRRVLDSSELRELELWQQYGNPATTRADGQRAHMAIDYELLLSRGVYGIGELIGHHRSRLNLSNPKDLEKDFFYRGCLEALQGLLILSDKYADYAQEQAEVKRQQGDMTRSQELIDIAQTCRCVPRHPAKTFRQAMQAIHFTTWCMCAGNQMLLFQLGRPDRYLLPFYERDVAKGVLGLESAQELIDCLCLLLNEYTPRGLAVGLMVCGRDSSGRDVTNDLSYMFINSIGHTRLAYPGIGVCWNSDTPDDILTLSTELLAQGHTHPAMFNDDVITSGLMGLGLSNRDACQYIHSTCVEITPIAISNVYVASPYHNLVQYLHDCLNVPHLSSNDYTPTVTPTILDFDRLISLYAERLGEAIAEGVKNENKAMMSRAVGGGFPLLSCFVGDCLARGLDIDMGGARVNWVEPSFVGLANAVDSLAVIRQLVFEENIVSLSELREALMADYQGYEHVKALVDKVPKYGNDVDRVDELACLVIHLILVECEKHKTYWNDAVVPGLFCWQMHTELGRNTCASPDGRRKGFPFADGSGPAQGREKLGPTAAVLSSTKWNHSPMIGGVAVNLRFSPGMDKARLIGPMKAIIRSYLGLGGMEAQVNVVDRATLQKAQESPALYQDLVVRIAGYSDYFISLSPAMQAEVMARTELEV